MEIGELHIRDLDEKIVAKYKEQAKKRGMSLNKYLVGVLTNYALAPEVKELDVRYQELMKLVVESIETNTGMLHELVITLQGEKNV